MIIPDKITPFKDSIISKLPYVISVLQQKSKSPVELWEITRNQFEDINEYILTLDVAFVLGAVELIKDSGVLKYVE